MSQSVLETEVPPLAETSEVAVHRVVRVLGGRRVLDGISFRVGGGERVGVVGRSGVGKSTLLSVIAGLDEPDGGDVAIAGVSGAEERLARCALMPQRDCLLPWRTALDNAGLALENAGHGRREARLRTAPMFERFGLAGAEGLRPAKLSAGMRQRVAFVRTLLADKDVVLLDEPFGALDAITRMDLQEWLVGALAAVPRTVLLVTHDVEEALLLCDRVLVLAGGRIAAELAVSLDRTTPRRELVVDRSFLELRERALEAIG